MNSPPARTAIAATWMPGRPIGTTMDTPYPVCLDAALQLARPGAVIAIDNVVRDGAVVEPDSDDPRVRGVREVVAAIAANPSLEATAIQTVGIKGWDGLIVLQRQ